LGCSGAFGFSGFATGTVSFSRSGSSALRGGSGVLLPPPPPPPPGPGCTVQMSPFNDVLSGNGDNGELGRLMTNNTSNVTRTCVTADTLKALLRRTESFEDEATVPANSRAFGLAPW
jgi:hypothetical protein